MSDFNLDEKQEVLLRKAVQLWMQAKSADDKAIQSEKCVLCRGYVRVTKKKSSCGRCPVYKYTGKEACRGTPAAKPLNNGAFSSRRKAIIDFGNKMLMDAGLLPEMSGN